MPRQKGLVVIETLFSWLLSSGTWVYFWNRIWRIVGVSFRGLLEPKPKRLHHSSRVQRRPRSKNIAFRWSLLWTGTRILASKRIASSVSTPRIFNLRFFKISWNFAIQKHPPPLRKFKDPHFEHLWHQSWFWYLGFELFSAQPIWRTRDFRSRSTWKVPLLHVDFMPRESDSTLSCEWIRKFTWRDY